MTLDQLYRSAQQLWEHEQRLKWGDIHMPVYIQRVDYGVTFAEDIHVICKGQPGDGRLIWVCGDGHLIPPWHETYTG